MAIDKASQETSDSINQQKDDATAYAKEATKQSDTISTIDKAQIEADRLARQAQLDADQKKVDAQAAAAKAKVDAQSK